MARRRRKPQPITYTRASAANVVDDSPPPPPPPKRKVPKNWPYDEMSTELYAFLKKHRPETWGDAIGIIHDSEELPESNFMTDLLWHTSTYGPKVKIRYT